MSNNKLTSFTQITNAWKRYIHANPDQQNPDGMKKFAMHLIFKDLAPIDLIRAFASETDLFSETAAAAMEREKPSYEAPPTEPPRKDPNAQMAFLKEGQTWRGNGRRKLYKHR